VPSPALLEDRLWVRFMPPRVKLIFSARRTPFKWISDANGPLSAEPYIMPPIEAAKSQSQCFIKEVKRSEEKAIAEADDIYVIGWSLLPFPAREAASAGSVSSNPATRIAVSKLTTPVTAKLKHSAMNPAFKPR